MRAKKSGASATERKEEPREVGTHRVELIRSEDLRDLYQLIEVIVTLELQEWEEGEAKREEDGSVRDRTRDER